MSVALEAPTDSGVGCRRPLSPARDAWAFLTWWRATSSDLAEAIAGRVENGAGVVGVRPTTIRPRLALRCWSADRQRLR